MSLSINEFVVSVHSDSLCPPLTHTHTHTHTSMSLIYVLLYSDDDTVEATALNPERFAAVSATQWIEKEHAWGWVTWHGSMKRNR